MDTCTLGAHSRHCWSHCKDICWPPCRFSNPHVRKDHPTLISSPASHAKPRHVLNIPSFDFAKFSLSPPLQQHCGWKFPAHATLPFFAILPVLEKVTSNQNANCHTSGSAPKQQWPRLRNCPKMAATAPHICPKMVAAAPQ